VIEVSNLPAFIPQTELRAGGDHGLSLAESSERDLIARTLRSCNGHVAAAASALGLAKSTVYAKLRRYGIRPDLGSANDPT